MYVEGNTLFLLDLSTVHFYITRLLGSSSLGNGHGNTKNGVGTKLGLVLGAIELVKELVDLGLVLDIKVLPDQSRSDNIVDIGDSLGDTCEAINDRLPLPLTRLTAYPCRPTSTCHRRGARD